jgi:hypothetical protein
LAIRAFDIQSGWRDAYERQRKYMRRDIFMGKLNPEKFSQRLHDLNKYLDYIPIENTTVSDKTIKAYGKSLPEDEIRSIMGRSIPPERTVNFWHLEKNLGDSRISRRPAEHVSSAVASRSTDADYCKDGWKDARQKNEGKRKKNERNHQHSNGGRGSTLQGNTI